jgi:hypothetical protein
LKPGALLHFDLQRHSFQWFSTRFYLAQKAEK